MCENVHPEIVIVKIKFGLYVIADIEEHVTVVGASAVSLY